MLRSFLPARAPYTRPFAYPALSLCKRSPARRLGLRPLSTMGPTQQPMDDDLRRPDEYELRVGFAIAVLQEDLPQFFNRGLSNSSIYANTICLSDPHYTRLSIHGRTAYLGIAETLRWSLRMYFDDVLFEIVKMRVLPEKEGDKGVVRHVEIRWRLEAIEHARFFFFILGRQPRAKFYEGEFVYTFDSTGRIGEHRIQRIVPPPSRPILLLHSLGGRLRALWERRRVPELSPGI